MQFRLFRLYVDSLSLMYRKKEEKIKSDKSVGQSREPPHNTGRGFRLYSRGNIIIITIENSTTSRRNQQSVIYYHNISSVSSSSSPSAGRSISCARTSRKRVTGFPDRKVGRHSGDDNYLAVRGTDQHLFTTIFALVRSRTRFGFVSLTPLRPQAIVQIVGFPEYFNQKPARIRTRYSAERLIYCDVRSTIEFLLNQLYRVILSLSLTFQNHN